MTPNPMKMATPVRPSSWKITPDIPLSNETYMSNRTQLAQLREMDAAQAARLPVDHLALLLEEVSALRADAKHLTETLNDALHRRYGEAATALRRAEGKDTGRVRLEDHGFAVIADLPKKVEWDQAKLASAIATIREWGEDPADYVSTEIRVPETRYTAWPPGIRAVFEPARTLATGRPSYALEAKEAA